MQEEKDATFSHKKTLANEEANKTFSHEKTVLPQQNEQILSGEKKNDQIVDVKKTEPMSHDSEDYEILDEIARGGMGIVFRGKQYSLQREVAIKKIMDHDKNKKKSFVFESLVTAFLDHPNIVPVYELKQSSRQVMLAMKLVGGVPWSTLLHPKTAKERELAARYDLQDHFNILFSVTNAIDFAHNKKIVHCDLKPSNVMIGEFGEVLVMDWGIAVDIDDSRVDSPKAFHRSHIRHPMGTPSYMPIELARGQGRDIGPWTDVYLLGGILYEILTRKAPNTGENILQILAKLTDELQLKFDENIPEEIRKICVRALQKNKEKRYQTVQELKKEIEDFIKHKQSIEISTRARKSLAISLDKIKQLQKSRKKVDGYERIYNDLSSTIASFQESLKLWTGNTRAREGEYLARLSYLKFALSNQDIAIAKSQLPEIKKFTTTQNAIDIKNIEQHIEEKDYEKTSIAYIWSRFKFAFLVYGVIFCLFFVKETSANTQDQDRYVIGTFLFLASIFALLSLHFTIKQILLITGKVFSSIVAAIALFKILVILVTLLYAGYQLAVGNENSFLQKPQQSVGNTLPKLPSKSQDSQDVSTELKESQQLSKAKPVIPKENVKFRYELTKNDQEKLILIARQKSRLPDYKKIVASWKCADCHKRAIEVWKKTAHYQTYNELHKRPSSKHIIKRLGLRGSLKRNDLCHRCHYTRDEVRGKPKVVSGVSCESCHGPGKDWVNVHNDKNVPKDVRRKQSIKLGMGNPTNIYLIAQTCYECHSVPDEKLVNVGKHSIDNSFELVRWSQGTVRHNFISGRNEKNSFRSAHELQTMFVVGAMLDLEYALRGLAKATTPGRYAAHMRGKVISTYEKLKDVYKLIPHTLELKLLLYHLRKMELQNFKNIEQCANLITLQAKKFSNRHKNYDLSKIDHLVPKSYK
ncbi:protein kinase domain-containing protein [Candidatus Uabimicrobium amorphum]|uniref:Cytochrome c554 n=1 Tax=Uabimicrobium amorphum TaxID=2596890 RepID=A0A5S9IRF5_UABAM|nr:protein kinase [Candidatus Uabimicrobium amorphum]BBM86246.1 cytochrome c554 [Candidatus Uabimicrobium amorphum]